MHLLPEFFAGVSGFQWDAGNSDKNWIRHRVTQADAEQVSSTARSWWRTMNDTRRAKQGLPSWSNGLGTVPIGRVHHPRIVHPCNLSEEDDAPRKDAVWRNHEILRRCLASAARHRSVVF